MPRNVSDFCLTARAGRITEGERYGIEVEAEGMSHQTALTIEWPIEVRRWWNLVHDGSLRNGLEWVSNPLSRASVPDAVGDLWRTVIEPRTVYPSVRTGIHIHVNMIGRTTTQVLRMLQHYALLEPVLFAAVGTEREENIYCIPWYRSLEEPRHVYQWLGDIPDRTGEQLLVWDEEPPTCKYSALNVSPISTKGTVEFRHAPTFDNMLEMLRWWDIVAAIYRTWDTEYNVFEQWEHDGPLGFCDRVFRNVNIPQMTTEMFDRVDVMTVAECLGPSVVQLAPGWGIPPELNGPGQVQNVRRTSPLENVSTDDILRRYSMDTASLRALRPRRMPDPPPELRMTVRDPWAENTFASPPEEEPYEPDDDDNDDDDYYDDPEPADVNG